MIAAQLAELTSAFPAATFAASSDGPAWLLLLGPAAGGAVYFLMWRYYRNTDASHSFEHETRVEAQPITGNDAKVDEVRGTKRTRINGANESAHRQRVQRLG